MTTRIENLFLGRRYKEAIAKRETVSVPAGGGAFIEVTDKQKNTQVSGAVQVDGGFSTVNVKLNSTESKPFIVKRSFGRSLRITRID